MRDKLFTLSRSQREDIWRRFKQSDDHRVAERLHAILLLDSGHNTQAVSHILHVHPKTLKRWVKAFASGGEDALISFKYVGGDGWLTDDQQQQFTTWLDAEIRSTTEAITWVEEHFGLAYSDSGMRKLLKRLDYRYKQPSVLPAKADPVVQAAWVDTYTAKREALMRRGKVYFLDAAHMLHAAIPSQVWIKRGTTRQLKTNSGRNRLNILGAYSPDDQDLISLEGRESCDGERVVQLLRKIRAANPGKRLLIVLDNASYNHAGPVIKAAEALRIQLLYLPPYSPNLNLIERFWKFLRRKVARNRFYATFAEFRTAVQNVLNNIAIYRDDLASLLTERFQLFTTQ
jgi:transposase